MAENLQAGDVVTLKSDTGMKMTIEWIESNKAHCIWFHPTTGQYAEHNFNVVALAKVSS